MKPSTPTPNDDEKALRDYLASLPKDELLDIAMRLNADCKRLRRELDDHIGVIR